MVLSEIGQMAGHCWLDIPSHFPFVILDAFVVMPDHIHGIIIINKTDDDRNWIVDTDVDVEVYVDAKNFAHPQCNPNPQSQLNPISTPKSSLNSESIPQFIFQPCHLSIYKNRFGTQSKNLASIIRGYKIGITKFVRSNNLEFAGQSRYYDYNIRNKNALNRIRNYIIQNPENWKNDK